MMKSSDVAKLGAKVRGLRRREGLTQAQLAERLGISASYLNLIESNRRPLPAPLLIKLAQLFGVDLQTFATEEDARLVSELMEVVPDPLFEQHELVSTPTATTAAVTPGPTSGRGSRRRRSVSTCSGTTTISPSSRRQRSRSGVMRSSTATSSTPGWFAT